MASSRDRRIWIGIAIIGLVALAFGLWDLLVERDGGENPLWQVALPGLLVVIAWMQARKEHAPASAEESRGAIEATAAPRGASETTAASEPREASPAFPGEEPREEGPAFPTEGPPEGGPDMR